MVSGESGGGNLTLAVAHKAKREAWLHEIAGVYAQCPYISNRYLEQPDDLPSLKENDGYIFNSMEMAVIGSVYDPDGEHSERPHMLARKCDRGRPRGHATARDLRQ